MTDRTLTVELTESSINLISSAIRHLQGKLQSNAHDCVTLAEKMFDIYGDFEYSSGISAIEEPFSKIISKSNKDLALCDELMRAFDQFIILIKTQEQHLARPCATEQDIERCTYPLSEDDL